MSSSGDSSYHSGTSSNDDESSCSSGSNDDESSCSGSLSKGEEDSADIIDDEQSAEESAPAAEDYDDDGKYMTVLFAIQYNCGIKIARCLLVIRCKLNILMLYLQHNNSRRINKKEEEEEDENIP